MKLKPCPYRQVDDEGHILCDKIKTGDRAVSPNLCRVCPIAAIHCAHLRATLDHQAHPPLTVRYGNGKTELWDDRAPALNLHTAACAAKIVPIHSPRDCAACPIRQPLIAAEALNLAPRAVTEVAAANTAGRRPPLRRPPRVAPAPVAPAPDARSNIVAQKIIQLQEWLAGHKTPKPADEENTVMPIAVGARPGRVPAEEKRVGWTD